MLSTQKQLRELFWETYYQFSDERRASKSQNEYGADICTAWCEFVDSMYRDGQIDESLADRATL